MIGDRYVLLGLARPRAGWFRSVAHWATSAALPAEFTKCVSSEEVRAHLRSGGTFSAVLVDAGLPVVDRDLLAAIREAGCAGLVIDDGRVQRDWVGLGASAVLPADLSREALLESLARHATMVGRPAAHPAWAAVETPLVTAPWEGRAAAVCGPGGTGSSTVAIALAQGLAGNGPVLLADFCLRGDQAMLHDAREVFPGVEELVEAHRIAELSPEQVRTLTYDVGERGYELLLGLRRPHHWAMLRPKAVESALATLRRAYALVVGDIDADFEAEDDAGSADVAERCMLARVAAVQADAVFVVGMGGMKGLHSLVRVLAELTAAGVPPERIQPVVNAAPRHPSGRAEITGVLADLAGPRLAGGLAAPLFLPRRKVGQALRDGARIPNPLPQLLTGAWHAVLGRAGVRVPPRSEPEPVKPGALGSWSSGPEEATGS